MGQECLLRWDLKGNKGRSRNPGQRGQQWGRLVVGRAMAPLLERRERDEVV